MNSNFRNVLIAMGLFGAAGLGGAVATTAMNSMTFARAEHSVSEARESLTNIQDLSTVFKTVSKAVEPSVVQIQTRTTVVSPVSRFRGMLPFGMPDDDGQSGPGGETIQQGTGSGVVMEVSSDGAYILTNNHVVANANALQVTLSDGRVVTNAKVVGTDPQTDLAVVKLQADRLIPAQWGDSGTLEKGDWVIAFGSPLGYVGSMTHGIVSALDRQVGILGAKGFEDFIQTDAAINPGNSGGPLVNTKGEVIGINSAIASRTGGFQGIGFAVPTKIAKPVFERLKTDGKITRGWLGVQIVDVNRNNEELKSLLSASGYKGDNGVYVESTLRNGPSQDKLIAGDVVTAVNGKTVKDVRELRQLISVTKPGIDTKLTVFRNGKSMDVDVKLGEMPDDVEIARAGAEPSQPDAAQEDPSIGVLLRPLNSQTAQRLGIGGVQGALVAQVQPGSPAARAGIRRNEVITQINGVAVADVASANAALKSADLAKGIRLNISNSENNRVVFLQQK